MEAEDSLSNKAESA